MKDIENRYQVVTDGGRVKSAGVAVDFVFEQGQVFQDNPGADTAAAVTKTFATLRENPPSPIRNRFFPLDRGEIKAQVRRSPALYRSVLKNDQGAGKFMPFEIGKNGEKPFPVRVAVEEGYVITEAYYEDQLRAKGHPTSLMAELTGVQDHFGVGNLNEAKLSFERLEQESEQAGVIFRRRAGVGRNALMFIHPAQAEHPIVMPHDITHQVERQTNSSVEQLLDRAEFHKRQFAAANNLPHRDMDDLSLPVYFQADIHIQPNGEIALAELQVPDVGLFLAGLPILGSSVFERVHAVVKPMKEKVIDGFEKTIKKVQLERGVTPIYLVTRSEVIEGREDVLEIRELDEIAHSLQERGYSSKVISAATAATLDGSSLLFLFNLDPQSTEFGELCKTYLLDSKRKLIMTPDPFLRVAEREITDYSHTSLSGRNLSNFLSLVKEVETPNDKPERVYAQMMALDYFLRGQGIEEDVLHLCHPALPTPIPAYRYDTRSMHLAANIIQEGSLEDIQIRSIPISPDRGVVKDTDGGTLYATFRYMFVRKDI